MYFQGTEIYGRRPCSEHRLEGDAQREPIAAGDESEAFPLLNLLTVVLRCSILEKIKPRWRGA